MPLKRTPLPRGSSRLKRGQGPKRSGRINPINRARRKKEHARVYGDKAPWIRTLPSVVSGQYPTVCSHINPRDRGELPHGTGRKHDSKWTVPLTLAEEKELHNGGQATFEARHNVNLTEEAEHYHRAWLMRGDFLGARVERVED